MLVCLPDKATVAGAETEVVGQSDWQRRAVRGDQSGRVGQLGEMRPAGRDS